jgi:spore maturation protein CgeB
MKCIFFYHAFSSCWNNGNAHFLRGVTRALSDLGHDVVVYEPVDGWSRVNAIREGGVAILAEVPRIFSGVTIRSYRSPPDLEEMLDGADLVLVHEWNPPDLIEEIGRLRRNSAFTLLFHDTHHRAITARDEFAQLKLDDFDGVLAFGEILREIYLQIGWANRAYTWHEAADTAIYHPMSDIEKTHDIVWIGNWGDGEREVEIREYLIDPVAELHLSAKVYGVRYSQAALSAILAAGVEYHGWLPAHRAPQAFASGRTTVHVPRAPYARSLPGIPTIRMFETMACGIPVVSAPWEDIENLFPKDCYLRAANSYEMSVALKRLLCDPELASAMAARGLQAITERHTCQHRAFQLLEIVAELRSSRPLSTIPQHEEAVP